MDNYREEIQKIVGIMSTIHGFNDFCMQYAKNNRQDKIIETFIEWKGKNGGISPEEEITLKIIKEKFDAIWQDASPNKLSGFLKHLSIKDSLLDEFLKDFSESKTGQVAFKIADVQHYKTITEKIAYTGIDIRPVYHKYKDSQNPYINAQLVEIFNRAGMYKMGLFHLKKVLSYVFAQPNPYWDTPYGIYGCTEAVWELQYLLGRKSLEDISGKYEGFKFHILELLFLYLSRSIHIVEDSIHSANYLSNRATLIYDYKYDYTMIFANNGFLGTNIDIQFMSDKAYAYEIASKLGIAIMFQQDFWDSLKMYQHGNLIPNASGGLHDIEDATMGELNKRGWFRSIEIGNRLYQKYLQGCYHLNRAQIDDVIVYLLDKYPDREVQLDWHDFGA